MPASTPAERRSSGVMSEPPHAECVPMGDAARIDTVPACIDTPSGG
jgi:hypothetical protein